jgi:hypothetical protein
MWMLRFDLLTKFREQCGHLTLRWAVAVHVQFSGEPVAQRKWSVVWMVILKNTTFTTAVYTQGKKYDWKCCKQCTKSLSTVSIDRKHYMRKDTQNRAGMMRTQMQEEYLREDRRIGKALS